MAPILAVMRGRVPRGRTLLATIRLGKAVVFTSTRLVGRTVKALSEALSEALAGDPHDEGGPETAASPVRQVLLPGRASPDIAAWELRVLAAEARSADLERRLAATERDVLELRSRNVCLHGKLAAASATARYQSLALELDAGLAMRPPPSRPH